MALVVFKAFMHFPFLAMKPAWHLVFFFFFASVVRRLSILCVPRLLPCPLAAVCVLCSHKDEAASGS